MEIFAMQGIWGKRSISKKNATNFTHKSQMALVAHKLHPFFSFFVSGTTPTFRKFL